MVMESIPTSPTPPTSPVAAELVLEGKIALRTNCSVKCICKPQSVGHCHTIRTDSSI
jgi:hypothetical protein